MLMGTLKKGWKAARATSVREIEEGTTSEAVGLASVIVQYECNTCFDWPNKIGQSDCIRVKDDDQPVTAKKVSKLRKENH